MRLKTRIYGILLRLHVCSWLLSPEAHKSAIYIFGLELYATMDCNLHVQYLPAEISRLEIRTWWDYRPWLWPRALLKQRPTENAPSIPEVVETPR